MRRRKMNKLDLFFLIVGMLCIAYYVGSLPFGGLVISVMWIWLALGLLCFGLVFGRTSGLLQAAAARCPAALLMAGKAAALLFFIYFLMVECLVISHVGDKGDPDLDYIIVLGAKVKGKSPGVALQYRIDAAYGYLQENPGTKAILSGGQGPDEGISEARCMANELEAMGIDRQRLLLEEQSTTTAENMRFSRDLIEQDDARVGIVTNNFHVFRSIFLARKQGINAVCGVAAQYRHLLFIHYVVREFMTVTVDILRGNLL